LKKWTDELVNTKGLTHTHTQRFNFVEKVYLARTHAHTHVREIKKCW